MGKYGTNLEGFGAFEGGVNADKGAPLVSTSSDGETALLFGPAALREIQAGVANGDFAIPPDAAGDTITEENPLPYWTFTDVNSAGAITAAIVADANAGSGNVLRFTVASGTLTGKSATLTRYIPVASSASRSFAFYAEATFDNATNSGQSTVKVGCQFYKADQVTTTGTAFESATYLFSEFVSPLGITAPDLYAVPPDLTKMTAPADAAYLKVTITIATAATQSANRVIDLTEVRVSHGSPELIITDKDDPVTYQPALITNASGALRLRASNGDYLELNPSNLAINASTLVNDNLNVTGNLDVTGYTTFAGLSVSQYDKGGSADTTTITTAGTYYALTNAEVSFSPQFAGQRWLLTFTGYASLNTTVIQYCFVRANVVTTGNVDVATIGYSRADNFGTSGRGATVAFTKVYVATAADVTAGTRKFKLYGTTQTTNGLTLSLAYTQMTAYPIG